jgi:hypothetical protein
MGLFGDRDVRNLKKAIETERITVRFAVKLGNANDLYRRGQEAGDSVYGAGQVLADQGRAPEAVEIINDSRLPASDDAATTWNDLMDQIIEKLGAE